MPSSVLMAILLFSHQFMKTASVVVTKDNLGSKSTTFPVFYPSSYSLNSFLLLLTFSLDLLSNFNGHVILWSAFLGILSATLKDEDLGKSSLILTSPVYESTSKDLGGRGRANVSSDSVEKDLDTFPCYKPRGIPWTSVRRIIALCLISLALIPPKV